MRIWGRETEKKKGNWDPVLINYYSFNILITPGLHIKYKIMKSKIIIQEYVRIFKYE